MSIVRMLMMVLMVLMMVDIGDADDNHHDGDSEQCAQIIGQTEYIIPSKGSRCLRAER